MRGGWRRTVAKGILAIVSLSLVWSALGWGFGTARPLEVVSGHSMLPTLRTGEVVLVRAVPPWRLRVGEIVAVHVPRVDQQTYHYPPEIVHRIVALTMRGATLMVQTKGDNEPAEPFRVPATDVRGRMLFAIPWVGYGWLFFQTGPGRIAGIGLGVLLLAYLGLSNFLGPEEPEAASVPVTPLALETESGRLAVAIQEYGEHLRSHTRVVRELGTTTGELRRAAQVQNLVLADLGRAVAALADTAAAAEGGASRSPIMPRRGRRQGRPSPSPGVALTSSYPPRRQRRRRHG